MKDAAGRMYSLYYEDARGSDGTMTSKRVRHFIGNLNDMSERAARREHARIMQWVKQKRGSVAPAHRGQTFGDLVKIWRDAIAPTMSPATVRQRESFFRIHLIPRFGKCAPSTMDAQELQPFIADLRKTVSRKTVLSIINTIFAVFKYAKRCGIQVASVSFSDLELGAETQDTRPPFFTSDQVASIINAAREPYRTIFAVAWATGMRPGEILALNRKDLDFEHKTIRVDKSADDSTQEIRQPKTKKSVATLPMPSALEVTLRHYLEHNWQPNVAGFVFPNKAGTRPRKRGYVVQYGLKPILSKLGISHRRIGMHAFRHGLATALVEAAAPITVLQTQMRHADVRTTLRVYAHAIPDSQREAMEHAARPIGTPVPFGTRNDA